MQRKHSRPARGPVFTLEREIVVPRSLDEVFAFFADAHNLEQLTPPWLRFEVLTPRPIEMSAGALIDYRLKLRGIPMRWQSEISVWDPPFRFVDEQRRGPYRYWHHEHTFEEVDGGVRVNDRVDYAVPGGRLIHRLFVKRDVERIFDYRLLVLEDAIGRSPSSSRPSSMRSKRRRAGAFATAEPGR